MGLRRHSDRGRAVGLRPLCDPGDDPGPGLSDELSRGGAGPDLPALPVQSAWPGPGWRERPAARRRKPGRHHLPRARLPGVCLPGGPADDDRRGDGHGADPPDPGGDEAHRWLDPTRGLGGVDSVWHLWVSAAGPVWAQGVRPGSDCRQSLCNVRGHLRGPDRRHGDLHHPVHDLRGGAGILGGRQVLP